VADTTVTDVPVSEGYFTAQLDFGSGIFTGDSRWLEIWVRCPAGSGSYTQLLPRQPITATPYALYALDSVGGGDITAVTASTGLLGGGTHGDVILWANTSYLQRRVDVACPQNQYMKQILSDGDIICAPDIDTYYQYFAGTGLYLGGSTFSADTTYLQQRVSSVCTEGSSIRAISQVGGVTCETDDDTTYLAGTGLNLDEVTFSVDTATIQSRVSGTCGSGYAIRVINQNGTVTCEPVGTQYWSLNGNAGTTPGTHYLGTSDNQALEIKVNNQRVFRFEPDATSPNLIGGHFDNWVTDHVAGATISGGGADKDLNRVTDNFGTVSGGYNNQAGNADTTVDNALYAVVSGGADNIASGSRSTVGGGSANNASGNYSTIPGGYSNSAAGHYSLAAGYYAEALNDGCFVWNDTAGSTLTCKTDDRWLARASGGVYFYTNSGTTSGVYVTAGGNAWNMVSNRDLKENFAPVNSSLLLERLAQYPISTWNYKSQDESILHIGIMADEFNSLIEGLGGEGMDYINSLDADGVAIAAIQGLYAENQELKEENARQQNQLEDLEARLNALEASQGGNTGESNLSISWMFGFAMLSFAGVWIVRRKSGSEK
jgi:hypothetical protein